jgi:hypothetical protein
LRRSRRSGRYEFQEFLEFLWKMLAKIIVKLVNDECGTALSIILYQVYQVYPCPTILGRGWMSTSVKTRNAELFINYAPT